MARKAYQAAAAGEDSEFFYVRRFESAAGAPDQFVAVTMRLTGNGAYLVKVANSVPSYN